MAKIPYFNIKYVPLLQIMVTLLRKFIIFLRQQSSYIDYTYIYFQTKYKKSNVNIREKIISLHYD